MNPILDLFQDTKATGTVTSADTKKMMRDALEMLPFLGNDVVRDLKRCLRDRDIQIQLWTVDLLEQIPMAYEKQALALLQRQLSIEERRKQRDNGDLIARINAVVDKLKPLVQPAVQLEYNPMLLNLFQQTQNMDIKGGYARYQVETDMLADARRLLIINEDQLTAALQTCLQYDETQVQIWAVRLCERVQDKYHADVIELLKQQLQAEEGRPKRRNSQIKNAIRNMLVKLGDNSVIETAMAQLSTDNTYDIRSQAMITLGKKARRHRDIFIDLAQTDPEPRIRRRAIEQLSQLRDDDTLIDLYMDLYEDTSVDMRGVVVRAMLNSQVDDPRIETLALKALDDDERKVMIQVIYALEKRSMPALMPKMLTMLTEMTSDYIWQVARGLRSQIRKYGHQPDDWQPLFDLILNASNYPSADTSSQWAVGALGGMSDLSAMPIFMSYMKRDSVYEGTDPNNRPSFIVLRVLRMMRNKIDWEEYETALQPYITSDDEDERLMVARIAVFAGETDGYSLLRQLRRNETSEIIIDFIKEHLP